MAQRASKLVISSAILFMLSLCVSNCSSSVVASSGGSLALVIKNELRKEKSNDVKETCDFDEDCSDPNSYYCVDGICIKCTRGEWWGGHVCDNYYGDDVKLAVGIIVALAICIPLIITLAIVACCFCCVGCAGHNYRQRRKQKPTQIVVGANLGYDQHGNVVQYQYGPPPVTDPSNPNNGPAPNPTQNQYQQQQSHSSQEQNADRMQEKLND